MSKIFLYIDESKDILNKKIEISVWVSYHKITYLNTKIDSIKSDYRVSTELHWYRRKTSQIFWKSLTNDYLSRGEFFFGKVYHYTFTEFEESGECWRKIYDKILSTINWVNVIYADKITLSTQDMKLLKYDISLHWVSIEFVSSEKNSSIQIIDLIGWFIRDEHYPESIWISTPIEYHFL